jgi:hypothetical protein
LGQNRATDPLCAASQAVGTILPAWPDCRSPRSWPIGTAGWAGIGLGDLQFAMAGPLVFRKASGRTAGVVAMPVELGAVGAVFLAGVLGWLPGTFPVMVVLGPLLVAQYLVWLRVRGHERTTAQYLRKEPHPGAGFTVASSNVSVLEDEETSPSDA